MSDRVRKPVEFTCLSVTRVSKYGQFVKGQKVVVHEDEPRIGWFRSGGWSEKPLAAITVGADMPKPDANPDDPMSTPIESLEKVSEAIKAALAKAKIVTVGDILGLTDEELLEINGIGEKSIANLKAACEAVVGPK